MTDQGTGMSDLWKRLRFVFIAILVYRIGTHIPIPGIDPDALSSMFDRNQGTIIEMFNLFSGGASRKNEYLCPQCCAIHFMLQLLCNYFLIQYLICKI